MRAERPVAQWRCPLGFGAAAKQCCTQEPWQRGQLVEAKLLTAEEAEATPFELARFNPPFTLPPLRTNEIMIPVDDAAASRVCES